VAYQKTLFLMALDDVSWLFSYWKPVKMQFFVLLCGSWHDFSWQRAYSSEIAEIPSLSLLWWEWFTRLIYLYWIHRTVWCAV